MKPLNLVFVLLCCFCTTVVIAQVKINSNSVIKAKGQLTTNATLTNASASTDLSEAAVTLVGTDRQMNTTHEVAVATLVLNNSSVTTLTGNWKITNWLGFLNGILHANDNARLLYTGTAPLEGNSHSFIEGYLTQSAPGYKFFPLGAGGLYLPATIEDIPSGTTNVGMRAVEGDAAIVLPSGINTYVNTHYWQLSSVVPSRVSLSLAGVGTGTPENFVVLESDATGGVAASISSSPNNDFVVTDDNVTRPLLVIGNREAFTLVIHDMITPFVKDGINDALVIGNLELAVSNSVLLLDRWGVKVKEWKDYTNGLAYDFTALSPGNYVCIVDFVYPDGSRGNQKGMVTVLNTK